MRQYPAFFDDHNPRLIYIAKKLKESLAVELLLSENAVEYGVETDRYRGGYVFQTERVGVFFYVCPDAEARARGLLSQHGYQPAEPLPNEAAAG